MKNTTQELIKALRRINKYGKSEITIDTYIRYICIDRDSMKRLNRNLAFAELMSRLAPDKERNEWYIAGILNDISEMRFPGIGKNPAITKAILTKARVNPGVVYAIENFRTLKDPRRWNALIAALNFTDSHIEESGHILTTDECCSLHTEKKECTECMYARYFFSQTNMHTEAEKIILGLRADLDKRTRKNEEGKEVNNGIRQRRMEEGSQEANAFSAG